MEKFTHVIIVGLKIVKQFKEPVLTFIISGNGSLYAKWVNITHLVDIDGTVYSFTYGFIAGYNVCYLQPCNIK